MCLQLVESEVGIILILNLPLTFCTAGQRNKSNVENRSKKHATWKTANAISEATLQLFQPQINKTQTKSLNRLLPIFTIVQLPCWFQWSKIMANIVTSFTTANG